MLEDYHKKDKAKQEVEMIHFQKVLDNIHKLCNDEENFQTGVNPIVTRIIKTDTVPVGGKTTAARVGGAKNS